MDRREFLKNASAIAGATAFGGLSACTGKSAATHPDLLASYWTIAGDVDPGTGGREWSLFDFRDRVEAAARAGFKGIGLWHADVEHTLERYSLADMKKILDDNGIAHLELEFLQLSGWLTGGDAVAAAETDKARLLGWAEALDARHIKVGDFFNTPTTLDQATGTVRRIYDADRLVHRHCQDDRAPQDQVVTAKHNGLETLRSRSPSLSRPRVATRR